jgi:hypothetical protein
MFGDSKLQFSPPYHCAGAEIFLTFCNATGTRTERVFARVRAPARRLRHHAPSATTTMTAARRPTSTPATSLTESLNLCECVPKSEPVPSP